jgi:iron complex outermembrane receptor protein
MKRGGIRSSAATGWRVLAGTCLTTLAAWPQPTMAQTAAEPSDDDKIETVVVTTRFIRESIQETPVAITAQTVEQLKAANVTNIGTLGAVVPNLQTVPGDSQSAGTPLIRMRGVIQGASSSLAIPPAVAIYTDDVYHATTAGSELDLTDIDHVEVNRGPQSTLSGNASIGGSIKLYSKDPEGDGSGYLSVTGGSRKKQAIAGALDFALSETLAARVSGSFDRQEGFADRLDFTCVMRKQGTPELAGTLPLADPSSPNHNCVLGHLGGGEKSSGQVKLRWRPNDKVDLIVTARHREEDMEETPEVALLYVANPVPNTANALVETYNQSVRNAFGIQLDDRFIVPGYTDGYASYATNCRPNTALKPSGYCFDRSKVAEHDLLSSKLNFDLTDRLRMTAITAYTQYSNAFTQNGDQSPLGYVTSHFENEDRQWSGELRFDGSLFSDKLDWVFGGYMLRFTGYQNNNIYFLTTAQDSKVRGENNSLSGFFHLGYHLTDKWRVSGGARHTDGEIAITINNPAAISVLEPVESTQNRWDWLLSTDYKITENILAYVSAASGSRPAGLTTIVNTARQLGPTPAEDLISYETGLKTDLFDRRLRLNLSAFYVDYKSLSTQLQGFECVSEPTIVFHAVRTDCLAFAPNTGSVNYFINVGIPAEIKGFEWEITTIPIEGLRFNWTGGYNRYTSGINTPGAAGYNFPGNHRQPEWNQHADLSYALETRLGTFTPRLDWNWQSQQDFDPSPQLRAPQPLFIIKPYSIWNAQVAYDTDDGNWNATLAVSNLTDKKYHYQVLLGTLDAQTRMAPPREVSLSVRRNF